MSPIFASEDLRAGWLATILLTVPLSILAAGCGVGTPAVPGLSPGKTPPVSADPAANDDPPASQTAVRDSSDDARPAGVEIDLLQRIEPARDQVRGEFQLRDGSLLVPAGQATQLELPITPPRRYRLEIDAQRLDGKDSLNIGLVIDGRSTMLVLEGWERRLSGLNLVDGRTGDNNATTSRQVVFERSAASRIVCDVEPRRIQVRCNGKSLIDWRGDPSRLTLDQRFWKVRTPGRLTLGAWKTSFRVSKLSLFDLDPPELATNTPRPSPRIPDRAPAPTTDPSDATQAPTDPSSPPSPSSSAPPEPVQPEPVQPEPVQPEPADDPLEQPVTIAWSAEPDPLDPPLNYTSERISLEFPGDEWVLLPDAPSNFFLVAAGEGDDWKFRVFDLRTGTFVGQPVSVERQAYHSYRISPAGRYVAGYTDTADDIQLVVWSFVDGREVARIPTSAGIGDDLGAWFGDEHRLAILQGSGKTSELSIWDIRTGDRLHALTLDHPVGKLGCAGTSPGGNFLALTWRKQLQLIDLAAGTLAGQIALPEGSLGGRGLAFPADGSELAVITTNDAKDVTQLWCVDMKTGETLLIADHGDALGRAENNYKLGPLLDWFPDKRALLFGGRDVIDRQTGKVVHQVPTNLYWMMPKRILRPDTKLDMVPGPAGAGRRYQTVKFARDELEKALATVAAGGEAVDTHLPPLTAVDLSAARRVDYPDEDPSWSVVADPRPAAPVGEGAGGAFRQKILLGRFGATGDPPKDRLDGVDIRRVMFSAADPGIAVAHQELRNDFHRQRRQVLTRHDLRSGRTTATLPLPDNYRLIDVSPSGNLALTGLANEVGAYPRLDVIQLTPKQHLAGWRPYTSEPWADDPHPVGQPVPKNPQTARWAWFLDDQHVVTVNPAGKLVCWQLPDCRPLYLCEQFGEPLAHSAGRRYVVGAHATAVYLLEAATGRWAGHLPLSEPAPGMLRVAFRPDGKELAAITLPRSSTVQQLVRWDLSTGRRGGEFPIPFGAVSPSWNDYSRPDHAQSDLEYRDDRFLLLEDRLLLDLTNRAFTWRYSVRQGGFAVAGPDNRTWYYCRTQVPDAPGQLFEIHLTAAEMPDALTRREAADTRLENQAALAPGQAVRVEVDLAGASLSESDEACRQAFEQLLRGRSLRIDPAAERVLSITAAEKDNGARLRLLVRRGPQPGAIEIPQRQIDVRLAITHDGKQLWKNEWRDYARAMEIRTDDPASEVRDDLRRRIRELLTNEKPLAARLPSYIFPPGLIGSLPVSVLLPDGVELHVAHDDAENH